MVRIEVVYALPERAWSIALELPAGATVADGLAASRFESLVPGLDADRLGYAVFGQPVQPSTVLRDGDRLELLRPLIADPKQARRMRARRDLT
jgi:putative ubiquitin-RnfH superfamily antitoxin RatB of RatAB toxin-antitoxin module